MISNGRIKVFVLLGSLVFGAWLLYPSIQYYRADTAERERIRVEEPGLVKRIVNLGLDLQGGMRLVLELSGGGVEQGSDALDRVYTVMEGRINGLGVSEPLIQKQGTNRLVIELPGLRDPAVARELIGSTARLQFRLLEDDERFERAIDLIDRTVYGRDRSPELVEEDGDSLGDSAVSLRAQRLFGGTDSTGESEVPPSFGDLLADCGRSDERVAAVLAREDVGIALQSRGYAGSEFLFGNSRRGGTEAEACDAYLVAKRVLMHGDAIADARAVLSTGELDAGQWKVDLEFTRSGARIFARLTGANTGKRLAIILDNRVYSAPQIRQKITGGSAEITGDFTAEEAKVLAVVIRAGALPVPVKIVQEQIVGPSLGQDSIKFGLRAAAIGMAAIFLYMAWYYRLSGVYANIALLCNGGYVLAVMGALHATLTLPGIAGLILNLGMAVDANVLICERIREELKLGKTVRSAIAAGYRRAMVTIVDSNLTTLITAGVLFWIGTGPIRGFAVTLGIGVSVSLFSSLFITRLLYEWFTDFRKDTISI